MQALPMNLLCHLRALAVKCLCGFVGFFCWTDGVVAQAQPQTQPLKNMSSVNASIKTATCLPVGFSSEGGRLLTVNLPPIDAQQLQEERFGEVTSVVIDISLDENNKACSLTGYSPFMLVFDDAFAALAPFAGLLRNTARENPAANVFVQIGLMDNAGGFAPLNLSQAQPLDRAIKQSPGNTLLLGARYVAANAVAQQLTGNVDRNTARPKDAVSPGSVQVQLPFLMKVY